MSFIGAFKNTYYLTKQYLILLVLFPAILYPQDPPSEFDFNISIFQSFYFFINSDIDGEPLIEDEDWIAAFHDYDETMEGHCINIGDEVDGNEATNDCQDVNGDGILSSSVDVCVGSYDWSGEYTTVPVMGDDQTQWTAGYMRGPEDFKDCNEDGSICDNNCNADGTICLDCDVSSAPDCSETQWEGFWTPDLGNGQYDIGEPFFDANVNGQFDPEGEYPKFKIYDASENMIYDAVPSVVYPWSTSLAYYVVNITVIRDCNGDLGGKAFIDNCGECVEGNTGLEENYLDIGCGCNEAFVGPFFEDSDNDGLGAGDEQYFCSNPGVGWSENNNDPFPSCTYNYFDCNDDCGGNATIDDCGICSGGYTEIIPNDQIDCNGECFGFAYFDDFFLS